MMNKSEFKKYFMEMEPMKYHEDDLTKPKAIEMIENKDNQFFAMRKYDGEWCRAIILDGEVILQSRSISKVTGTYGDKTELVPHIVDALKNTWPAGTVLLGELAFDDFESTSREVGAILRCKAPKAIERQKDKKLHFFVFDVLAYDYEVLINEPFEKRFFYGPTGGNQFIQRVLNISGEDTNFMDFADWIWAQGGEGIMIVRKDMKYAPGKRTAWLSLKVKKKLGTLSADIVDTIEPNKLYEGKEFLNWEYWMNDKDEQVQIEDLLRGRLIDGLTPVTKPYFKGWKNGVVVNYSGRQIKVTSGLTDQDREWLATPEAQNLIKSKVLKAEITGMEVTEDSIRHPIFLKIIKK